MKRNKNLNDILDNLLSDIILPTDEQLKEETKSAKISLAHKGRIHTEQTKLKFSKAKIGKKRDILSVKKSIDGSKKTKWFQLLEKYPLQSILDAQLNNGNHQSNTRKELDNISYLSYIKLCKHYGIDLKKSNYEKGESARIYQSEPILVWKSSKRKPFRPIGKPTLFNSVSECCKSFEPKLHKANMLKNMINGTPYREMFFKKLKK